MRYIYFLHAANTVANAGPKERWRRFGRFQTLSVKPLWFLIWYMTALIFTSFAEPFSHCVTLIARANFLWLCTCQIALVVAQRRSWFSGILAKRSYRSSLEGPSNLWPFGSHRGPYRFGSHRGPYMKILTKVVLWRCSRECLVKILVKSSTRSLHEDNEDAMYQRCLSESASRMLLVVSYILYTDDLVRFSFGGLGMQLLIKILQKSLWEYLGVLAWRSWRCPVLYRGVCTNIFWDALSKFPHEDLARSSLAGASLRGPGIWLVSCCLWQTQVPAAAVLLQFWQCLTWFATLSVPTTVLISYILFHWFQNPPHSLGSVAGVIV